MWESFHDNYSTFLDSEATFQIHDLETIVGRTEYFVLILSEGYFESEFCCKELAAAIKSNTKFIIVRDYRFEIPREFKAQFGLDPSTVANLLASTPQIVWVAEYHNECVDHIQGTILGAGDQALQHIEQFAAKNANFAAGLKKKLFDHVNILDLTKYPFELDLDHLLLGIKFNYGCTIEQAALPERITNSDLFYLQKHCNSLLCLNLYRCVKITDEAMQYMPDERLKFLSLLNCDKITDVGLMLIADKCPKLRVLNLGWGGVITDSGMEYLTRKCSRVQTLNLSRGDITDLGVGYICERWNLRELYLTYNKFITNECIKHIGKSSITTLALSQCPNITDEGLAFLVGSKLENIYLKSNRDITDKVLETLAPLLPQLKVLDLHATSVTDKARQSIQQQYPDLCLSKVIDKGPPQYDPKSLNDSRQ